LIFNIDNHAWREQLLKATVMPELDSTAELTLPTEQLWDITSKLISCEILSYQHSKRKFIWNLTQHVLRRNDQFLVHFLTVRAASLAKIIFTMSFSPSAEFLISRLKKILTIVRHSMKAERKAASDRILKEYLDQICELCSMTLNVEPYPMPLPPREHNRIIKKEQNASLEAIVHEKHYK
jgi:hypothetical protein